MKSAAAAADDDDYDGGDDNGDIIYTGYSVNSWAAQISCYSQCRPEPADSHSS